METKLGKTAYSTLTGPDLLCNQKRGIGCVQKRAITHSMSDKSLERVSSPRPPRNVIAGATESFVSLKVPTQWWSLSSYPVELLALSIGFGAAPRPLLHLDLLEAHGLVPRVY